MSRLVVVSNRVGSPRVRARAGGLEVALLDALRERGGLWFGWSGRTIEGGDAKVQIERFGRIQRVTLDLSEDDYEGYYNAFSNQALWPLFHYRLDLTNFDRRDYESYLRVNYGFAHNLAPLLEDDDMVWVHDFHFLAFGEELRRMGVDNRIGFFLHIPFPSPEVLVALPSHEALVRALFAYDVVGFQTAGDLNCFMRYAEEEAGGQREDGNRVTAFGRTISAGVFPIGIDGRAFADFTHSEEAKKNYDRNQLLIGGRTQIIGVERLDYTKGIPVRFHAFERLLIDYPDNAGRVSLMQIAPPSRSQVVEYQEIRRELEGIAGRINGRFADYDWTPIRYLNRAYGRKALAGLYRASRVGLVTPLRDGMNLVAKEYIAAQDELDPGVLVLSRFAGSARQLTEALIVNPYDIEDVANALQRAIHMPLEERRERWNAMRDNVFEEDVSWWASQFLDALESARAS